MLDTVCLQPKVWQKPVIAWQTPQSIQRNWASEHILRVAFIHQSGKDIAICSAVSAPSTSMEVRPRRCVIACGTEIAVESRVDLVLNPSPLFDQLTRHGSGC